VQFREAGGGIVDVQHGLKPVM